MRRTKILATLGPASSSEEMIERLLTTGVDAFRLNFSHGKHEEHARLVRTIREVATELGRYIPIVGDIQGPKLRIDDVDGVINLENGQAFVIGTEPILGNQREVSTSFTPLPQEVRIGQRILINDGLVELIVTAVDSTHVTTRVLHGGPISSKKGMNFPDSELSIPAITDKDKVDVKFAVEQGLDYIAASFIRRRSDILDLRALLHAHGGDEMHVIAKLEKPQAIDHLDDIREVTDAVAGAGNDAAEQLAAKYIVVFTQTGFAARLMSKFRPKVPIIALTPSSWVARRMNLLWGVQSFVLLQTGDYHEQIVDRVD